MDKYDLYTLCVQDPPRYVRFLRAIHGGKPNVLRDDFAGPGAIALAWARSDSARRAVAVDADPVPLRKAKHPRVKVDVVDVRKTKTTADIVTSLNFGVCELHTRRQLMVYLKNARKTLKAGGVIVCDLYGGATAMKRGAWKQERVSPSGQRVVYTWEQVEAEPTTGMVRNNIHFALLNARGKETEQFERAFEYNWRLWTIAELREAMLEAGFESVDVYDRIGSAVDGDGNMFVEPVEVDQPLDKSWVVYVAGRK